ncbi:hypothetical protein V8E52_001802 [Russula decolorans]
MRPSGISLTDSSIFMSATAANLLQASSTSSQQLPHLELRILTNHVGIYPEPPTNITSDELAYSAMTTGPPNPTSPSDFTCLLSGPLDDFLVYSSREQPQWLTDIAHDIMICDPALKRGSLQVCGMRLERCGGMTIPLTPPDHINLSL